MESLGSVAMCLFCFCVLIPNTHTLLHFLMHGRTHTHTAFCDIFSHCTRLQVINVKCCTLLDNAAVICLTQNCPFLQSLCLSGCHMICDKSIVAISLRSHYLHALDLTKTKVCTSNTIIIIYLYSNCVFTLGHQCRTICLVVRKMFKSYKGNLILTNNVILNPFKYNYTLCYMWRV